MKFIVPESVISYLGVDPGITELELDYHDSVYGSVSVKMAREGLVHLSIIRWAKWNSSGQEIFRPATMREMALTLIHELTHVRQFMEVTVPNGIDVEEWYCLFPEGVEYLEQPGEVEARKVASETPEAVINDVMHHLSYCLTGRYKPWTWKEGR